MILKAHFYRNLLTVLRRLSSRFSVAALCVAGCITVFTVFPLSATGASDEPEQRSGEDQSTQQVTITSVVVNRSNIFDDSPLGATTRLPRLQKEINRFHKITRESVILREAGVKPGDTVSVADIEDIERRLRRLGLFSSVSSSLVTTNDGVELRIETRDNFSLVAGASGSFLGGVSNLGLTVGERNLFGSGDELLFSTSRTSQGRFRGSLSYNDLHFFNTDLRANYRLGRTDDGNFFRASLTQPFRLLNSKRSWTVTTNLAERETDFYQDGVIVVAVPEDRNTISGGYTWRSGTVEKRYRRGLLASFTQVDYSEALGALANTINVPEDNRTLFFGGLLARDTVSRFAKVQGLDTLEFVQDITLGSSAELRFGVNFRDESDESGPNELATAEPDTQIDPTLSLSLGRSAAVGQNNLLNVRFAANAVFEERGLRPWSATASLRAFNTTLKKNTFAFRMDFSTGEDGSDLPVQLTLGEGNGLRGYTLRRFEGRQRLRLNLESRYRPGWKLGVVDIGAVGFFDAGFAAPTSDSSPELRRSIGVGLRIASNAFLGARLFRIDVALPLDPPSGENNPSLSLSLGQVFRF